MTTQRWLTHLRDNPLPWLLSLDTPPVRHLALRWLLDTPADEAEVVAARRAAMSAEPIISIRLGRFEAHGAASKWVTLHACRMLKMDTDD